MLTLRECTAAGGGCVNRHQSTALPARTWTQVVTSVTATATGDQIKYLLYVPNLPAGAAFLVDELSMTAPAT
ncbi:MAG: hypothetical protein ACR2KL_00065 [Nocardioidaceae bacterium]